MAEQGASNGGGDGEAFRGEVGFAGIDALERIALTVGVDVDVDAVARAATLSRDGVISSAMTSSRSIRAVRPPRACSSSSLRRPASSSTSRDARHASPYSYSSTLGADEASTSPSQKVKKSQWAASGGVHLKIVDSALRPTARVQGIAAARDERRPGAAGAGPAARRLMARQAVRVAVSAV